jgi:hypothetical protein
VTKKKFVAYNGATDVVLVDGYSVGDKLLEGVMFECRFFQVDPDAEQKIVVNIQPACAEYFSGLNETKWLRAVTAAVNDPNYDSFLASDEKGDAWIEEERERVQLFGVYSNGDDGSVLTNPAGQRLSIAPAPSFNMTQSEIISLEGKNVVVEIETMATQSDGEEVVSIATIVSMRAVEPPETPPYVGEATIEPDPDDPESFLIVFPPGLLEKAGFNAGDEIVWTVIEDEYGKSAMMTKKK